MVAAVVFSLAPPAAALDFGVLGEIGALGSARGQMIAPSGVALDGAGSVYVGDQANHRVVQFTTAGRFVRAWGFDVDPAGGSGFEVCTSSCKQGVLGDAAGQMSYPQGVAVDGAGRVYVAGGNARMDQFTAEGGFVRAWGFDVDPAGGSGFEVCTSACQAGAQGGAAGQMTEPYGVALDGAGGVYVADWGNHRVVQFTTAGRFVKAWGFDVDPAGGSGFEVCTNACQAGVPGEGAGQMGAAAGVAVDGEGRVYVTDLSNHRVVQFTTAGRFVKAWGFDVDPAGGSGFEVCTSSCKAGEGGVGAGQMTFPRGVAVDGAGSVYVGDTDNNRVDQFTTAGRFVRAWGRDVDPAGGSGFEVCTSTCKRGEVGASAGEMGSPTGVAVDCRGAIYAADTDNGRVQRFGEPSTVTPPPNLPPSIVPLPTPGAVGAPSAPPTEPPDQGLTNPATPITVGREGTVKLCDATNPPTAATAQSLTGTLPKPNAPIAKRKSRKPKPTRLTLGSGYTTIAEGQTRPVTVTLTAAGRRALAKRRRLTAQATIEARGPDGQSVTVKRTITLEATKKKGKKRRKTR